MSQNPKKIRCPTCHVALGEARGNDRVRLFLSPVVVRVTETGQALDGVCRTCQRDVSIPIPLPLDFFRLDRQEKLEVISPQVPDIAVTP